MAVDPWLGYGGQKIKQEFPAVVARRRAFYAKRAMSLDRPLGTQQRLVMEFALAHLIHAGFILNYK